MNEIGQAQGILRIAERFPQLSGLANIGGNLRILFPREGGEESFLPLNLRTVYAIAKTLSDWRGAWPSEQAAHAAPAYRLGFVQLASGLRALYDKRLDPDLIPEESRIESVPHIILPEGLRKKSLSTLLADNPWGLSTYQTGAQWSRSLLYLHKRPPLRIAEPSVSAHRRSDQSSPAKAWQVAEDGTTGRQVQKAASRPHGEGSSQMGDSSERSAPQLQLT